MNNDINNNINFIGAQKLNKNAAQKIAMPQHQTAENSEKNTQDSLNFLGTLGCAQVNMNNLRQERIKKSLQELKNDPEHVEAHIALCDSLVKYGKPLEDAILITDGVFKTLSSENTYI